MNFKEGEFLEFVKFIPTFIDRFDFYNALLNRNTQSSSLISRAFNFFKVELKACHSTPKCLQSFTISILSNLKFILFETFDTKKCGSLYEGLAVKNELLRNEFEPKLRPGK